MYILEVFFFFGAKFTSVMNVQNHCVIILKYHLIITHGTTKSPITHPRLPPSEFETTLKMAVQLSSKEYILKYLS